MDIIFRSEEKAISPTRGASLSSASFVIPARIPATTRATSVASPSQEYPCAFIRTVASLHSIPHRSAARRSGSSARGTRFPPWRTSPRGSNPSPSTSYSSPPANRTRTFISPFVRVPVLSEQITVAAPSASTADSFRTRAFRRTIRWTPRARLIVTIAGRPSGIAATARLTAVRKSSSVFPGSSRNPTTKTSALIPRIITPSCFPRRASWRWRGVSVFSTCWTIPAIFPSWVFIPVAMTTPFPRPASTRVPMYAMFRRSARNVLGGSGAMPFDTAMDSPVREASFRRRLAASINRRSAGTLSPAPSRTTSPGTSSRAGITLASPPRTTCARGAARLLRASRDFSARYSWM